MDITIKKTVSMLLAVFFSFYCMIGLGSSITDEPEKNYKNVILFIGDGMGENTLGVTEQKYDTSLTMKSMPVHASGRTSSFMLPFTDSAAGGTALSCGIKVWFNSLGKLPFLPFVNSDEYAPLNLTELAIMNGKSAGVVTTDKTTGATPSAFSSHVLSRDFEEKIVADQLASDLDLIWGCDTESINEENANANGFTLIDTREEMLAVKSGERSIAQFNFGEMKNCRHDGDTPSVKEMTESAIDLLDDNDNGFFLMVEGACIDKFSHDNDFDGATINTVELDKAIAYALEYAEADGETLVVVTADHETGGIKYNEKTDEYYYTITQHSMQNVPVFVSATDAGWEGGKTYENRQTAVQIARVMGFGSEQFPAIRGNVYNK